MEILKGKHAGRTGKVHQFANDWMTVDLPAGDDEPRRAVVVKPTQVQLDPAERAHVAAITANVGSFWQEWRLNDDGTFTALRQRPARGRRA